MSLFTLECGDAPLIFSMPHGGLDLPDECHAGLIDPATAINDADFWIDQVYGFAAGMDITRLTAHVSRIAIDLNRDPSGQSLYPGQATTGLVPTTDFDGNPLYHAHAEPDAAEVARRIAAYHAPYHAALAGEIARLRALHSHIVVYDCHSIRSHVPWLFNGELPVLNLGTHDGTTCAPELQTRLAAVCDAAPLSHVVNGRFKGGWITRHYANPAGGVHCVQMELAQRAYMVEPLGAYDAIHAAPLTATLQSLLTTILDWLGDQP
ncbi:MAG: N-formylglutamate deformylase [Alphaproteobacteria bacterium]|nr:N-formylglutamate deformylase [Alphaproteobacteria bacterium]MDE2340130.1 N-formylglutamate deformylase [Alphaproteobacteria bacterium]